MWSDTVVVAMLLVIQKKTVLIYISGSQPLCRGTLVCRNKYTGVPRSDALEASKILFDFLAFLA